MTSYSEMLRDPRWQKRRLEIMERARWACEYCGETSKTFNVHHRIYRKGAKPWEYEDCDLACLCEICHQAETMARAQLNATLAELDGSYIQQVLGFAEGLLAQSVVVTDEYDKDLERTWLMKSKAHVRGFLEALWGRVYPDQIDAVMAADRLKYQDIENLSYAGFRGTPSKYHAVPKGG